MNSIVRFSLFSSLTLKLAWLTCVLLVGHPVTPSHHITAHASFVIVLVLVTIKQYNASSAYLVLLAQCLQARLPLACLRPNPGLSCQHITSMREVTNTFILSSMLRVALVFIRRFNVWLVPFNLQLIGAPSTRACPVA
jgi:hypothetical protein